MNTILTAEDWETTTDIKQLVNTIIYKTHRQNNRKFRLAACACARELLSKNKDQTELLEYIAFVESCINYHSTNNKQLHSKIHDLVIKHAKLTKPQDLEDSRIVNHALNIFSDHAFRFLIYYTAPNRIRNHKTNLFTIIRDIFTNPFIHLDSTNLILPYQAIDMAQVIYNENDYTATPMLADLLEEKGYTPKEIIDHLRQPKHVKGCNIIDIIRKCKNKLTLH